MLLRFEHHHRRALREHESITAGRERAAYPGRVAVARRQRAQGRIPGNPQGSEGGIGSTGDDHIGLAPLDHGDPVEDGLGAAGAGSRWSDRGTVDP